MNIENIINQLKNKLKDYFSYVLILIPILLVLSFVRNVVKIKKAGERIVEAEERVTQLKEENEELAQKLEDVRTNEFVERQLRDKLGFAKEGETIVVLPDDEVLRKLAPKHEEEKELLPDPNWKKWYKLFF